MPPRQRTAPQAQWYEARPDRLVVVRGGEELLAQRAITRIIEALRAANPEVDVERHAASTYQAGQLDQAVSASLFSTMRCVVFEGAEQANDAFVADMTRYMANPAEDAVVVVWHSGATRARKIPDAIAAANYPVFSCEVLKRETDKLSFVGQEFRSLGRTIEAPAARALVEALGADIRELAGACSQLAADTTGPITVAAVEVLCGGRMEVTGFQVADATVAGRTDQALVLVRHAFDTGVDPVVIVAAVAAKLRTLCKVAGARRRNLDPVRDLGMLSWQVDKARRELGAWDSARMGQAIEAVARADSEVKGAGRDPHFATERMVLTVTRLANPDRRARVGAQRG